VRSALSSRSYANDDRKYRYKFFKRTGEMYDLAAPKPKTISQRTWNRWAGEKMRKKRDDEKVGRSKREIVLNC
jgi:hypothetical protein